MPKNLMNEPLVWMSSADFGMMLLGVNIASNILHFCDEEKLPALVVSDLDGNPINREQIEKWRLLLDEAQNAAMRSKFVPEDTLPKLRLVLMSD